MLFSSTSFGGSIANLTPGLRSSPSLGLSPHTPFIVPLSVCNYKFVIICLMLSLYKQHKHKKGYIRTLVRKEMKLLYMFAMTSSPTHIPQSLFSQFRYDVALPSRYYTVYKYKVFSHMKLRKLHKCASAGLSICFLNEDQIVKCLLLYQFSYTYIFLK